MSNFTTWRSLIDGLELGAIPDSDVYLHDDWGDNKLQDREDSGTTTHNGVEGVYRPEWNVVGDAEANNEQLIITAEDEVETGISLNLDETITWELEDLSLDGDRFFVPLFSETSQTSSNRVENGYSFRFIGDNSGIVKHDSDGTTDGIVTVDLDAELDDAEITRQPNGEWELIIDGTSEGTATDTEYDNPQHAVFTAFSGTTGTISEFKVS